MSWYPHTVTAAATTEPVTLAEAKAQVRVDGSDEDGLLTTYLEAARAHVEAICGTPIVSRTVTAKCDCFKDFASFPLVPLQSVSSIAYTDTAGDAQTLATTVYEVRTDGKTASIVLKYNQSWPLIRDGSRITVTAVVGYSAVPPAVKHALLLLIGFWFDNRSTVNIGAPSSDLPHAVAALLANNRAHAF